MRLRAWDALEQQNLRVLARVQRMRIPLLQPTAELLWAAKLASPSPSQRLEAQRALAQKWLRMAAHVRELVEQTQQASQQAEAAFEAKVLQLDATDPCDDSFVHAPTYADLADRALNLLLPLQGATTTQTDANQALQGRIKALYLEFAGLNQTERQDRSLIRVLRDQVARTSTMVRHGQELDAMAAEAARLSA